MIKYFIGLELENAFPTMTYSEFYHGQRQLNHSGYALMVYRTMVKFCIYYGLLGDTAIIPTLDFPLSEYSIS